jgi:hypothetical protein
MEEMLWVHGVPTPLPPQLESLLLLRPYTTDKLEMTPWAHSSACMLHVLLAPGHSELEQT